MFNIPDKDVKYCMTCPNSPGQAEKLYNEFCKAQDSPIKSIEDEIDVSAELLQMAWEEAAEESEQESSSRNLTPASFIELVHAHAASAMEKYLAWKYLQSEQAHVFFKEIKSNGTVSRCEMYFRIFWSFLTNHVAIWPCLFLTGRVVSFKAKTRKAVDNAKDVSGLFLCNDRFVILCPLLIVSCPCPFVTLQRCSVAHIRMIMKFVSYESLGNI